MSSVKPGLHPRSRHKERYDFALLTRTLPDLARFVSPNAYAEPSIDFSNPEAVRTLNRALLAHFYGVSGWDFPREYLCPAIPGRADYIHHVADLLGSCNGGVIPRGPSIRVLDLGVGANCIYPLIGHFEYGWSFVGSELDPVALTAAGRILGSNPQAAGAITLRRQAAPTRVLQGLLDAEELFDLSICNPPFHASLQDAQEGSRRKWKNLGRAPAAPHATRKAPVLNFGGQGAELWCPGGEAAFVRRMIEESAALPRRFFWFSTLISKQASLPAVEGTLRKVGVVDRRTLEMTHGQKTSRVVAWTFLSRRQQEEWRTRRWGEAVHP